MEEIDIPELPSNSNNVKPKIQAVRVAKKEESALVQNLKDVGSYILMEVLIPAAKDTITAMVSNGIEMLIYGEGGGTSRRRSRRDRGSSYVSYSSIYDDEQPAPRRRKRQKFDLEDIEFASVSDAEEVLEQMQELLEQYGQVRLSDFYELVNLPDDYTSQEYGWTSLRNAQIRRTRGGCILDLPEPRLLR